MFKTETKKQDSRDEESRGRKVKSPRLEAIKRVRLKEQEKREARFLGGI